MKFAKEKRRGNLYFNKDSLMFGTKKPKHIRYFRILFLIIILILISLICYNKNKFINISKEEIKPDISISQASYEVFENMINTNIKQAEQKSEEIVASERIAQTETKPIQKEVTSRSSSTFRTSNSNEGYTAFTATGYCPCASCCGKTNGITARGTKAVAGKTVAMSSKYSFGTQVEIKGYGTYIVEDRGGAIQGNKIDIYFDTHQQALNFGRRTVYLKIIR